MEYLDYHETFPTRWESYAICCAEEPFDVGSFVHGESPSERSADVRLERQTIPLNQGGNLNGNENTNENASH